MHRVCTPLMAGGRMHTRRLSCGSLFQASLLRRAESLHIFPPDRYSQRPVCIWLGTFVGVSSQVGSRARRARFPFQLVSPVGTSGNRNTGDMVFVVSSTSPRNPNLLDPICTLYHRPHTIWYGKWRQIYRNTLTTRRIHRHIEVYRIKRRTPLHPHFLGRVPQN